MKVVVFHEPYKVSVQDRPTPTLKDDRDIIVKVNTTALCGSELHMYRGLEAVGGAEPIMGHEFTGHVVQVGSAVKTVAVGDQVVSPFTTSCGECFFCKNGGTARCVESQLFGSPALDGGQAEYVRVPNADGTVIKAPDGIPEKYLILMADIFPTGYYGVNSAISMSPASVDVTQSTIAIIGCGPVGLCAVAAALTFEPKYLFAIDSVNSRLDQARELGAEPLNFQADPQSMIARIKEATEGRGADMAVEVVGLSSALRTAFDLIRPFGVISSIGVHNAEMPWTATEGYNKNLRLQMGRCPVRSIFAESLEVFKRCHDKFDFMFDKIMPLSQAEEAYDIFNKRLVQKVVFIP
ncbi:Zn-dependent alcohol dehydrogenase [Geosmithia morbida]|uniref:Zn-dependent alcohol dehydrogenase n=1 Tax=Geosmithia morbida TaxID=1094350 RepID=A0A9P5D1A2_9HYPO|nr:Zn-dependent alcohol dehydrogenase [Geosmithia morbida]KAF4120241.1 Zn-dependent alcohol dehydrogenase [Geosmithia morbida]